MGHSSSYSQSFTEVKVGTLKLKQLEHVLGPGCRLNPNSVWVAATRQGSEKGPRACPLLSCSILLRAGCSHRTLFGMWKA